VEQCATVLLLALGKCDAGIKNGQNVWRIKNISAFVIYIYSDLFQEIKDKQVSDAGKITFI
jgi:hypothetical protein